MIPGSVLLFVHPPFFKVGDKIFFDAQAQNGLRLWADNFDVVRVMAPLVDAPPEGPPPDSSELQPFLDAHPGVEPIMLPRRGTRRFLTEDLGPGRKVIAAQIEASQYLVFAFSGYIGDWGTVACHTARRMGRPYAVFKDLVGHRALRIAQQTAQVPAWKRPLQALKVALMKHSDHRVVRAAALSLLHGQDTMAYYGPLSRNPHMVHDIHISKQVRISQEDLDRRLETRDPHVLRVIYAGRLEGMKGPDHWTEALPARCSRGLPLQPDGTGSAPCWRRRKNGSQLSVWSSRLLSRAGRITPPFWSRCDSPMSLSLPI